MQNSIAIAQLRLSSVLVIISAINELT